jgi:glutamate racemase
MTARNSIGVFDSGVGGLTVYKALRAALPYENFVYLGDMARLPYGSKGRETVTQYATQAARRLVEEKIKLLVVACNTATAHALGDLQKAFPALPCLGVIEPGAAEAARVSSSGRIAVLATDSTVSSGVYPAAIKRHRPDAVVTMLGCNLLVSLAEAGWHEGPEAEAITARYLKMLGNDFDTLVLGCTHFPLLLPTIRKLTRPDVTLVDSAVTTASNVRDYLAANHLFNPCGGAGKSRFLATDAPENFTRIAAPFLAGETIPAVEHVHILSAT